MDQYWKGELEAADPAEREANNLARLQEHVDRTRANSAFYRRHWEGVDTAAITSVAALVGLPKITKQEIIDDQAEGPPYGSLIACDPDEIVRLYLSPGPQTTYFTRDDLEETASNAAWVFWCNGFRPSDVVDVTINYHWVIAGTIMDDGFRQIGCGTIPGGIGNAAVHLENLRWTGATGLFAFPTFLEELAKAATETGIDPRADLALRRCTIAGEMHSADHRTQMEDFWGGMTVREMYGGAEVPFSAAECEHGNGMHTNPDMIVEVLHPDTSEPVAPGEPGVIVVSELTRRAYPMIRYSTGDITAGLDTDPCACGRTTPRLGRILGRTGDILRVKGLFVVPKQVAASLARFEDLGAFQIVADRPGTRDEVTIRIEHSGPVEAREGLTGDVVAALKDGIRLTCAVVFEDPGTLDGQSVVDDRRKV
jgi:phenylacetate-CoA ligase